MSFLHRSLNMLEVIKLQLSVLMFCGCRLFLIMPVCLLKILCNLPTGKCVSTRLRKLRATFVLTFLLNRGLKQMMLRCLFLRDCCVFHDAYVLACG